MKAIIFNSGLGSRMGDLTTNNPKCLVKLYNGETILERQIRILSEYGIKDFIITTGPFEEQIIEILEKYTDLNFIFVKNEEYLNTNYIVSMNNADDYLDDDVLLLHGDLVFNKTLVKKILEAKEKSICLFNPKKDLPKKDFKGKFKDNILQEVSINIFDDDCFAFQPLYKLDKDSLYVWKQKVKEFVGNGDTKVYAENALNEVTQNINIIGMSYEDDYIDEIDNINDYNRVSNEIKYFDYKEQNIIQSINYIEDLKCIIEDTDKVFIVCGNNLKDKVIKDLEWIKSKIIFSEFNSNPKYEEIKKGVDLLKKDKFNKIISFGGGSSIDVAKCIKAFYSLDNEYDFLENKYNYNNICHIAIPTTAGTGSESTEIAVMYYKGSKYSVSHGSILPDYAILNSSLLKSLPDYQKKSTLLDALCQSIESYWSNGANEESKEYSKNSIKLIMNNYKEYIINNSCYEEIMQASNLSGKAINISRTTAPHSMSYILSQKYGISHGHAVALCLIPCWKKLYEALNKSKYNNKDNKKNNNFNTINIQKFEDTLNELCEILNVKTIEESIKLIDNLIDFLNLPKLDINNSEELASHINLERMNNNPIIFRYEDVVKLYNQIGY